MSKQSIGQKGEAIAARYLESHGYTVVVRNWRCKYGEIDLIAKAGQTIVFVEVKTRRSKDFDQGHEQAFAAITPNKRDRMTNSAQTYLSDHNIDSDVYWRIDVIAVSIHFDGRSRVNHVEDALGW